MDRSTGNRVAWLSLLAMACSCFGAQASTRHVVDIPRLPLEEAVARLAVQTGSYIGTDGVHRELVGPLKGSYTVEAALSKLLARTGLAFEHHDGTYAVLPGAGVGSMRTLPRPERQDVTRYQGSQGHESSLLAESVLVTGARLRDASTHPTPVTILDQEAISRLGASSLPDLLKYLSQHSYASPEAFSASGRQYAELRGVDATVVLINGRWVAPTAGAIGYAFDLNAVPLSAVERVEVLTSAASVFGAHAVGGVLNIVLKSDIRDPAIKIGYGTAQGGAEERHASLSTGYSHQQLQVALVLDYFERGFLLGAQRDRWRNQDYRRYGSYDWRASDGNISSVTGWNLPGLPAQFAAIPTDGDAAADDFQSTAGLRNYFSEFQFVSIVPEATRLSAMGSLTLKLPGGAEAFAELLYAGREGAFQYGPPRFSGVVVPASNPFNRFGVPVKADFLLRGIAPRCTMTEMSLVRSVFGLRGEAGLWSWELSALRSEEGGVMRATNQLNLARLASALASSDPAQALNVFQDGPGGSPQLLESLVDGALVGRYASAGSEAAFSLQGPLFMLPAGEVRAVIGGQWRRESMLFEEQALSSLSRIVSAGFMEAQLPLTSALRLSLTGRLDSYSDWGETFSTQYGFAWEPVAQLRLHVGYGTSFRPPSLYEVAGPRILARGQVLDPARNNEVTSVVVRTGGDPGLTPTVAATWAASVTWTPGSPADLQLSLEYWRIRLDDRIRIIPISELLADEAFYVDRVVRASPTFADIAVGLPGTLQTIDVSTANAGRLETSGFDISMSASLSADIGRFTGRVSATWVDEFDTAGSAGMAVTHRAGVASQLGTIAKWRAVASAEWEYNWTRLSTDVRFVSAYDDVNASGRNGRRVSSQAIVDLHASVNLGLLGDGAWFRELRVTAGVINAFDSEAPFAEVGSAAGFDLTQGDLRQRFGYIEISKKF